MSSIDTNDLGHGGDPLEHAVERYVTDLGRVVGEQEAAELVVAAAFAMLYRAQGGEKTRIFARKCYWTAVQSLQ